MKWRHWSILIVLVLLNYLIFSAAITQFARNQQPAERPTRTPQPTFVAPNPTPAAWIVLPTNTPARAVVFSPSATPELVVTVPVTPSLPITATSVLTVPAPTEAPTAVPPTPTPMPLPVQPTATAATAIVHVVERGETLGQIARRYDVTVAAIAAANSLANPNLIYPGQKLVIPGTGTLPTATPAPAQPNAPQATNTPRPPAPTATRRPPTATPAPARAQFTAELIWDPGVAPNCAGPAIANRSLVRDAAGNPVNGVVILVNCYGNQMRLNPTGQACVYEAGHYDWSPGQTTPQDWTCTAKVIEFNGQAVTSSDEISIHFDTNRCQPGGNGHQVAILNWTKWR